MTDLLGSHSYPNQRPILQCMKALRAKRLGVIEPKETCMLHILAALSASLVLSACSQDAVLEQATKLGQREFSPEAWAAASRVERGQMTASFMRQYDATTLDWRQVEKILGPSTGYYYYDNNPAYFVGPDTVSSIHGTGYLWAFEANKNNGRIERVRFVPEVK